MKKNLVFSVLSALFLCGCFSTAYYKTLQDEEHKIDKTKAVKVVLPTNSSIEERRFSKLLSSKLTQNGFTLNDDAKCGFVFDLQEPTYQNTAISSHPVSGAYANSVYIHNYSSTYKDIYLELACFNNDENQSIWEGSVSTELSKYQNYPEKTVENLVALVGEEYSGNLRISGNGDTKKFINTQKKHNWLLFSFDVGGGLMSKTKIDTVADEDMSALDVRKGGVPLNVRVGYMRKISTKSALGLNFTYTRNFIVASDVEYAFRNDAYTFDTYPKHTSQQLGVELMGVYNGWLLGVGVSKDIDSSVKFPTTQTKQEIDGLYLPIRLGYMWDIEGTNFRYSLTAATSLPLTWRSYIHKMFSHNTGKTYLHNVFSINMGFSYLFNLW